jgi:lupus La protein
MREFQVLGLPAIAHALREGAKAESDDALLFVSEDNENVRRVRPFEPNSTMWDRSAYVVSAHIK